ncbi:MAG: hypothetical protein ACYCXY_08020 [Acidimicrobiales bacterium]
MATGTRFGLLAVAWRVASPVEALVVTVAEGLTTDGVVSVE